MESGSENDDMDEFDVEEPVSDDDDDGGGGGGGGGGGDDEEARLLRMMRQVLRAQALERQRRRARHGDSSGEDEDGDGDGDGDEDEPEIDTAREQRRQEMREVERARARLAWDAYKKREFVFASDADYVAQVVDQQGVPWREIGRDRAEYRRQRNEDVLLGEQREYTAAVAAECAPVQDVRESEAYYVFEMAALRERSFACHPQLRHLLAVPTKQDVYYIGRTSVRHFCPIRKHGRSLVDMSAGASIFLRRAGSDDGAGAGEREAPGDVVVGRPASCRHFYVTTLGVHDSLVMFGGTAGEFVCYNAAMDAIVADTTLAHGDITNGLTVHEDLDGVPTLLASCNDRSIRVITIETLRQRDAFQLPWPVNYATQSLDRRIVCAVGDDPLRSLVLDARTGAVSLELPGQHDHAFSCAFSPDGVHLAIGAQDKTCRLFDLRNPDRPLHTLGAVAFPVRSVSFSSSGRFLSVVEESDYVHVYDIRADYGKRQVIDTLGDLAGAVFQPDSHDFYVSNANPSHGGLLRFSERSSSFSLDSLLL